MTMESESLGPVYDAQVHASPGSLYAVRNNRSPRPAGLLHLAQQFLLNVFWIDLHLTSRNLLIARPLKAKFANSQPALRLHRGPKCAARQRPSVIEFAQSCLRIEHRTNFIIPELRKSLLRLRTVLQDSRISVARKISFHPPNGSVRPFSNPFRSKRFSLFETFQSIF